MLNNHYTKDWLAIGIYIWWLYHGDIDTIAIIHEFGKTLTYPGVNLQQKCGRSIGKRVQNDLQMVCFPHLCERLLEGNIKPPNPPISSHQSPGSTHLSTFMLVMWDLLQFLEQTWRCWTAPLFLVLLGTHDCSQNAIRCYPKWYTKNVRDIMLVISL
jgi:hypothetical protein